jgi:hypothetical protein
MTRPALTLLALWLGIASAVAVGIVAGFLLLATLNPGAVLAAMFEPVGSAGSLSGLTTPGAPLQARTLPTAVVPPSAVHSSSASPTTPVRTALPSKGAASKAELTASQRTERPSIATASQSHAVSGTASWWASFGDGVYAALPGYVAGTHVTIRVWSGSLHIDAPVITSCGCFVGTPQERIVDLSPGILAALGLDPGRGLFPVTIEVLP